ncbi:MAG: NAD-dependent epimerase/dehydratase family protein [Pseudomonadota bacterium]
MSCFLVTGGAGFIGSWLADRLLAAGHGVRVLDDLSTGSTANLASEVTFLRGDVRDPAVLESALSGVDGVFWFAARASVPYCAAHPEDALAVNQTSVTSLLTLFRASARLAGVPVVFASSSAIYGNAAPPLVNEDHAPAPVSAYGQHKAAAERQLAEAAARGDARTLSLRFFNAYGPRQSDGAAYGGVLALLRARLRDRRPFVIHGDGGQARDFIHVSDVAQVCHRAMEALLSGDPSPLLPALNVCTGRAVTVLEAVAQARREGPLTIAHGASRPDDIRHSSGANAALRDWLGTTEFVPFEEGFARYLR